MPTRKPEQARTSKIVRKFERFLGTGSLKGSRSKSDSIEGNSMLIGTFIFDHKNKTETYVPAKKS